MSLLSVALSPVSVKQFYYIISGRFLLPLKIIVVLDIGYILNREFHLRKKIKFGKVNEIFKERNLQCISQIHPIYRA